MNLSFLTPFRWLTSFCEQFYSHYQVCTAFLELFSFLCCLSYLITYNNATLNLYTHWATTKHNTIFLFAKIGHNYCPSLSPRKASPIPKIKTLKKCAFKQENMEMCRTSRLLKQLSCIESERTLWQFLVSVPAANV